MRYVGGKFRQAKATKEVILKLADGRQNYLEPFIGGGSVFAAVAPHFERAIGADLCPEVPAFWQAVRDGWVPPSTMTKETYLALKKSGGPTPMRAWAAFAASYNGKYFGGYGPTHEASGRDYLGRSQRSTLKKAEGMTGPGVEFMHSSYRDHVVDPSWVVYCDPPYAGTMSYSGAPRFDSQAFWSVCEVWSWFGALVLVHEYTAPDNWEPVLITERTETMNHSGSSSGKRKETLWRLS